MAVMRAVAISRSPVFALAAVGIFWGGFAALVPDIKTQIGASDRQLGLTMIMSALGGISGTFLVPRIGTLLGRLAIPVTGLFLVFVYFGLMAASSVFELGLALFFVGLGVATLDITSNVRISQLETRHGLHLMNVNHAIYAFAFGGAAFATGLARKAQFGPDQILPAFAALVLVLVFLMWESPTRYGVQEVEPDEQGSSSHMPWVAILLTGTILFAAFVGENSIETWSALHIERTLGGAHGEGGYGPTMLGFVMGIARVAGHYVAEKIGEARLIFWSALLGTIGAVIIGAAPSQTVVLIGVAIVALGMAIVVPSVNSILGKLVSERQRSRAISRAWMFGMLGFFIGPVMMGLISEAFGLRVSFFTVAGVVAVMMPAVLALDRLRKNLIPAV